MLAGFQLKLQRGYPFAKLLFRLADTAVLLFALLQL